MSTIPEINYMEEIKKCKTMEDVTGKNGLMQRLLKDVEYSGAAEPQFRCGMSHLSRNH